MYENGMRIQGYQRKRLHKRKVKKSYAKNYLYGNKEGNWDALVIMYQDMPPTKWGHPLNYWKDYSLTGPRSYAKNQTNRTLRREFKNQSRRIIYDDSYDYMPYINNGNYRKYFDYDYTVW